MRSANVKANFTSISISVSDSVVNIIEHDRRVSYGPEDNQTPVFVHVVLMLNSPAQRSCFEITLESQKAEGQRSVSGYGRKHGDAPCDTRSWLPSFSGTVFTAWHLVCK